MTVSVFVARDCVYLTISRLPFTRTCNCYVTRSSSSTAYFLKRRKKIPACRTANSDQDQNELNTAGDNFVLEEDFSTKQYKESHLKTLFERFWKVAIPYWISDDKIQATLRLASVVALTLATTGISVGFNFIGRDFYNALASKDQEQFTKQLLYYLGAFAGGIPVFVLRDYAKDTLALRWRAWMTKNYLDRYFESRTFYTIQSQSLIDNPDQRIVDDVSAFTSSALSFSLTLFTALVDLISFSNILFGIYPPLFAVLVAYSLGGTAISVLIGKGLVNLNFMQEKKEADFRYGLVRIRENSESIAFYGGEKNEKEMLIQRFKEAFENLTQLLISSRNLDFFTSGYRYLIQILPAAVVAPMYFSGKIEFGIINQSYSAFNHVLGDFSLIVYQFQALSSFSAVIDRLGEFGDALEQNVPQLNEKSKPRISVLMIGQSSMAFQDSKGATDTGCPQKLLEIEHLTLYTPNYTMALIHDLSFAFRQGEHILIMGPSGTGKTSLLRAVAGLWSSGEGTIKFWIQKSSKLFQSFTQNGQVANIDRQGADMFQQNLVGPRKCHEGMFFLPQRPYMVLGTLRQQLLYPTWTENTYDNEKSTSSLPLSMQNLNPRSTLELESIPTKEQLVEILKRVSLDHLLTRYNGLDNIVDWSSVLSLGEQQRLAFARLLLARPKLALLDECTSALDEINEAHLYQEIAGAGITYVSIGHRSTLRKYHKKVLHLTKMHMQKRNWAIEPIVQGIEHLVKSAA